MATEKKKELGFFKQLVQNNNGMSCKSFGLILSHIVGGLLGVVIGFILIFDIVSDGKLDSDLYAITFFLIGDSVYMFGGGLNKTLTEILGKIQPGKMKKTTKSTGK